MRSSIGASRGVRDVEVPDRRKDGLTWPIRVSEYDARGIEVRTALAPCGKASAPRQLSLFSTPRLNTPPYRDVTETVTSLRGQAARVRCERAAAGRPSRRVRGVPETRAPGLARLGGSSLDFVARKTTVWGGSLVILTCAPGRSSFELKREGGGWEEEAWQKQKSKKGRKNYDCVVTRD